jgi:hypothetical protein
MPDTLKRDYTEASKIYTQSPRGACALLRLVVQKMLHLKGAPGRSINDDIAWLVALGISKPLQQMLDYTRFIGNDAVHNPDTLVPSDNEETAQALFATVNLIFEKLFGEEIVANEQYATIPLNLREAIEKRDA